MKHRREAGGKKENKVSISPVRIVSYAALASWKNFRLIYGLIALRRAYKIAVAPVERGGDNDLCFLAGAAGFSYACPPIKDSREVRRGLPRANFRLTFFEICTALSVVLARR